jgi:hypothetical protein
MSGNQQDVLIVLIRQTQRAQEDAKGTGIYIQNEAHKPQKPLQGLDRNPGQYWIEPLIDTMTDFNIVGNALPVQTACVDGAELNSCSTCSGDVLKWYVHCSCLS